MDNLIITISVKWEVWKACLITIVTNGSIIKKDSRSKRINSYKRK